MDYGFMKKYLHLLCLGAFAMPFFVSAQSTYVWVVSVVITIVDFLVPPVFTIAIAFFFYGLVKYVFATGDEKKKVGGKNIMIFGIVGMIHLEFIWAIVVLLQQTDDTMSHNPIYDRTHYIADPIFGIVLFFILIVSFYGFVIYFLHTKDKEKDRGKKIIIRSVIAMIVTTGILWIITSVVDTIKYDINDIVIGLPE
jgi:hypothetical protein